MARTIDAAWQDLMDLLDDEHKLRWRMEILAKYPHAKRLLDNQAEGAKTETLDAA
jgi:hypothetical protein